MKLKNIYIFLLLTMITLISLACKISLGGDEPPTNAIPVSDDAAITAQDIYDSATFTDTQNQLVAFTLTEAQVTSLVAQKLAQNSDNKVSNPQIYLQDGKIDAYATYDAEYFNVNVHFTLSVVVNADNELEVSIDNADLGPIPASDAILDSMSNMIDESIASALLPAATGFRVESIYIADGMATISGIVTR
jgi:uncharacterized protein YpmS